MLGGARGRWGMVGKGLGRGWKERHADTGVEPASCNSTQLAARRHAWIEA